MKTFFKYVCVAVAVTVAGASFVSSADASITIYNNRAAWEAAAVTYFIEDFEAFEGSQTEGAGVDVGDFTVRQVGTDFGSIFSEISTTAGSAQGINDGAAVGGATFDGGTGVNFSYDSAIRKWGADVGGWSDGPRLSAVRIDGVDYNLAEGQTFFGYIDTVNLFNTVDVVFITGESDGGALDNVSYGNGEGRIIPEPGAIVVWSVLALVGLGVRRRRDV